ncbi:MAG: hypothetical protein ACSLE6_12695 [Mycobacterium sp.]
MSAVDPGDVHPRVHQVGHQLTVGAMDVVDFAVHSMAVACEPPTQTSTAVSDEFQQERESVLMKEPRQP